MSFALLTAVISRRFAFLILNGLVGFGLSVSAWGDREVLNERCVPAVEGLSSSAREIRRADSEVLRGLLTKFDQGVQKDFNFRVYSALVDILKLHGQKMPVRQEESPYVGSYSFDPGNHLWLQVKEILSQHGRIRSEMPSLKFLRRKNKDTSFCIADTLFFFSPEADRDYRVFLTEEKEKKLGLAIKRLDDLGVRLRSIDVIFNRTSYSAIEIVPDKNSFWGKLAIFVKNVLNVSLVYVPGYLHEWKASATYSSGLKAIGVSERFLFYPEIDEDFLHELVHAFFDKFRGSPIALELNLTIRASNILRDLVFSEGGRALAERVLAMDKLYPGFLVYDEQLSRYVTVRRELKKFRNNRKLYETNLARPIRLLQEASEATQIDSLVMTELIPFVERLNFIQGNTLVYEKWWRTDAHIRGSGFFVELKWPEQQVVFHQGESTISYDLSPNDPLYYYAFEVFETPEGNLSTLKAALLKSIRLRISKYDMLTKGSEISKSVLNAMELKYEEDDGLRSRGEKIPSEARDQLDYVIKTLDDSMNDAINLRPQ